MTNDGIPHVTTDLLQSPEEVSRMTRQLNPGVFLVFEHLNKGDDVDHRPNFLPG